MMIVALIAALFLGLQTAIYAGMLFPLMLFCIASVYTKRMVGSLRHFGSPCALEPPAMPNAARCWHDSGALGAERPRTGYFTTKRPLRGK
jgi:hypothetical protein